MNLDQILTALPLLNKSDLDKINKHISALRSISGNKETQASSVEAWVLSLIIEQFKAMGIGYSNIPFLQKCPHYKSFCEKVPTLMEYLEKSHLTKAEKSLVIREGIGLLYKELCKFNNIVTERTILLYFHLLPSVLENSFPNYGQNGFLRFIIQR